MTKPLIPVALVLALAAQPALADKSAPAAAPAPVAAAPSGTVAQGVAVANLDAAVANSDAYRLGQQQRQVTYKATLDAAQARASQIDASMKPLVDKFNADRAAKKPDAILQADYAAIQSANERGKAEIDQMTMPISLSEAYVVEQVSDQLDKAVQQAMIKRGITLLLSPSAVIARAGSYELTPAIVAELNTLIPAAQLVPPQGWVPRQVREQQAARAAAQGGAAPAAAPATAPTPAPRPATPAGPQPDGR